MSDTLPPFLTDSEVDVICDPLKMPSAQIRYLSGLGLFVKRKPNGHALIARSEFERVLGAARFEASNETRVSNAANVTALREHYAQRKKNGTQARTG